MMIMLVLKNTESASLQDILLATGAELKEIKYDLHWLCHPKVAILLKRPNSPKVTDKDKFMINSSFTSPLMNVIIPCYKPPNKFEAKEEKKLIDRQRQNQIRARIVSIMKA